MVELHGLTLTEVEDAEGTWPVAECSCGWSSPPCPDDEIAAGFWGDHRAQVAMERVQGGAG